MSFTLPFDQQCASAGLPRPTAELRFAPPRKWMFDWSWPDSLVAVEIEGGIYGRGKRCPACNRRQVSGHGSIERLKSDMEKYNRAAALGWKVLRFTPEQVKSGEALRFIEGVLRDDT